MGKSINRVKAALKTAGVDIEISEMPAETRTAQLAADAVGCDIDQIAKSIIFCGQDSGRLYLFITAGGHQVDADKATRLAGETLGKADAAQIRAQTGFAIGGVAPVGHLQPIPTFMDAKLLEFDDIWAAAGTPQHVFRIYPGALEKASNAQLTVFT